MNLPTGRAWFFSLLLMVIFGARASADPFVDAFPGTAYNTTNWQATGGNTGGSVGVSSGLLTLKTSSNTWNTTWMEGNSSLNGFIGATSTEGTSTGSLGFTIDLKNITQSGGSGVLNAHLRVNLIGNDATSAQLAAASPSYGAPTALSLEFYETGPDVYKLALFGKINVTNSNLSQLTALSTSFSPTGLLNFTVSNTGGAGNASKVTISFGQQTINYTLPATYGSYFNQASGSGVHLFLETENGNTAGSFETATIGSFGLGIAPQMPTYGAWTSSYIGGGGYLQNIVFCPSDSNRLYTYVDMAGVYRSNSGGNSWRMIMGSMPKNMNYEIRTVDVDPTNADNLLVATRKTAAGVCLFHSTNGGTSWTPVISGTSFYGNGSIFRADGVLIVHKPGSPNSVLAATQDTAAGCVYSSSDDGATWTNTGNLPSMWPGGMLVDRSNANHVWLWTRGGTVTDNAGGVHGPTTGGLYQSYDFGATWARITTNLYNNQSPNRLIQDPSDPTVLWATISVMNATYPYNDQPGYSNLLVGKSTDGGATWTTVTSGLTTSTASQTGASPYIYNALEASTAAGTKFLVLESAAGNVYQLATGGSTWTAVPHTLNYGHVGWVRGNKGANWKFGASCGWIKVDPNNANHWFATDWFEIWQSPDAGATWNLSSQGIENTFITDIHPDPMGAGMIHLAMSDNGYFLSSDGGKSFSDQTPLSDVNCIDTNGEKAVAAAGTSWVMNTVMLSSNHGVDWTVAPLTGLPGVTGSGTSIHMANNVCDSITIDPHTGYIYLAVSGPIAAGNGGPYRSTDGGLTWTWVGNGLPTSTAKSFFYGGFWTYTGHEVVVGQDGTILCASYNNKLVYKFNPTSSTWSLMPFPGTVGAAYGILLAPDPTTAGGFYAAEPGGGVYKSADDGMTWMKIYTGSIWSIGVDPGKTGYVAIYDPTLSAPLLTKNGGTTWTNLDPSGLLGWSGNGRVASSGGYVYYGATGGGLFWTPAP